MQNKNKAITFDTQLKTAIMQYHIIIAIDTPGFVPFITGIIIVNNIKFNRVQTTSIG